MRNAGKLSLLVALCLNVFTKVEGKCPLGHLDEITGSSGIVTSPGYPSPYERSQTCTTEIRSSNNRPITIFIPFSDIGWTDDGCTFHFLKIYNGNTDELLSHTCGTDQVFVETQTDLVKIVFEADSWVDGYMGFKLIWNDNVAVESIIDPTGSISSPNAPVDNGIYFWDMIFELPEADSLIAAATGGAGGIAMHLKESNLDCEHDDLAIFNGIDNTLIGSYCGTRPRYIETGTMHAKVVFTSNVASSSGGNWTLTWPEEFCSTTYTEISGTISSPGFPDQTASNLDFRSCVRIPLANSMSIIFTHMDVKETPGENCTNHYVKLTDGNNDQELMTLCGFEPTYFKVSTDFVKIQYSTDSSVTHSGWKLVWAENVGKTTSTEAAGSLVSDMPSVPHYTIYEYIISIPSGIVDLTVLDPKVDCNHDSLAFFDNQSNQYIRSFCGSNPRYIKGISDSITAVYSTNPALTTNSTFTLLWPGDFCLTAMTSPNGSFTSPGYPFVYDANLFTTICINSAGSEITLMFTHMDVEFSDLCQADYIQVLDGNTDEELYRYCGTEFVYQKAPTDLVKIIFVTDASPGNTGWRLISDNAPKYESFSSDSGSITAPTPVPGHKIYEWNITVASAPFSMTLSDYNIDCVYAPLIVIDKSSGELLKPGCDELLDPGYIEVDSTEVQVLFSTESSSTSANWLLEWPGEFCDRYIDAPAGELTSPGFPLSYGPNVNQRVCIRSPEGRNVTVRLAFMDIEMTSNCTEDHLRIQDGLSGEVLFKGCGTETTFLVTHTSMIKVGFWTNGAVEGRGWRMVWDDDAQLINIHSETGSITLPGYPTGEVTQIIYEYTITVVNGPVKLNLWDFDVECACDSVLFFDGTSGAQILSYCGTANRYIEGTSTTIRILFSSDSRRTGGVVGQLRWPADECFHSSSETSGELTSPNFPYGYEPNLNFIFCIQLDPGSSITILVTHMALGVDALGPSCAEFQDNLKLIDGNTNTQIEMLCGFRLYYQDVNTNHLILKLSTNSQFYASGFRLVWNDGVVANNLGEMTGGSISSPIFSPGSDPSSAVDSSLAAVPENMIYEWTVSNPTNSFVLSLDGMDIDCQHDAFLIFVKDVRNELIAAECGKGSRSIVTTSGESTTTLLIVYSYYSKSLMTQWQLNWPSDAFHQPDDICDANKTGSLSHGHLLSRGFPARYHNSEEDCSIDIISPSNKNIWILFTHFSVEYEPTCRYDQLTVSNGEDGTQIAKYCGLKLEQMYKNMLLPSLTFDFASDGSTEEFGWKLVWDDDPIMESYSAQDGLVSFLANSSRTDVKKIHDWLINITSQVYAVQLIYSHLDCRYNKILFLDPTTGEEIKSVCGYDSEILEGLPSVFRMVFSSYPVLANEDGFIFRWGTDICEQIINALSGEVVSPGFPSPTIGSVDMRICISSISGANISVFFTHMDVILSTDCDLDFVQFVDGTSGDELLKYCGDELIYMTDLAHFLKFRFYGNSPVFTGEWRFIWDDNPQQEVINSAEGNITCPEQPEANRIYEWLVTVPSGIITLDLLDDSINCTFETLALFDGHSGKYLVSLCQNGTREIQGISNSVRVVYSTSSNQPSGGCWVLSWPGTKPVTTTTTTTAAPTTTTTTAAPTTTTTTAPPTTTTTTAAPTTTTTTAAPTTTTTTTAAPTTTTTTAAPTTTTTTAAPTTTTTGEMSSTTTMNTTTPSNNMTMINETTSTTSATPSIVPTLTMTTTPGFRPRPPSKYNRTPCEQSRTYYGVCQMNNLPCQGGTYTDGLCRRFVNKGQIPYNPVSVYRSCCIEGSSTGYDTVTPL